MNILTPFRQVRHPAPAPPHVCNVHLLAGPGTGKTLLTCGMLEHLFGQRGSDQRGRIELVSISKALTDAWEQFKREDWPLKSAPSTFAEPFEELILRVDGQDLRCCCHAGEVLRAKGGVDVEALRQQIAPQDLVIIVVNPWRADLGLARRGLGALISHLQQPKLGYALDAATKIACELLFGLEPTRLEQRDEFALLTHCAHVRLEPDPGASEASFMVKIAGDCDEHKLFRALSQITAHAVNQNLDALTVRQLIAHRPDAVVVLNRLDLLSVMKGMDESAFSKLFDTLFGETRDYLASQRVLARNAKLTYRPSTSGKAPVRIADIDVDGGGKLWRSIAQALERNRRDAPRVAVQSARRPTLFRPWASAAAVGGALLTALFLLVWWMGPDWPKLVSTLVMGCIMLAVLHERPLPAGGAGGTTLRPQDARDPQPS